MTHMLDSWVVGTFRLLGMNTESELNTSSRNSGSATMCYMTNMLENSLRNPYNTGFDTVTIIAKQCDNKLSM